MFPGMQGPQSMPDEQSYPMFWRKVNYFIAVSSVAIAISLFVRKCEIKAHEVLLSDF